MIDMDSEDAGEGGVAMLGDIQDNPRLYKP